MFATTNPPGILGERRGGLDKAARVAHVREEDQKYKKICNFFESWNAFQAFSCYCVNVFKKGIKRVLGMVARFFYACDQITSTRNYRYRKSYT